MEGKRAPHVITANYQQGHRTNNCDHNNVMLRWFLRGRDFSPPPSQGSEVRVTCGNDGRVSVVCSSTLQHVEWMEVMEMLNIVNSFHLGENAEIVVRSFHVWPYLLPAFHIIIIYFQNLWECAFSSPSGWANVKNMGLQKSWEHFITVVCAWAKCQGLANVWRFLWERWVGIFGGIGWIFTSIT